MRVHHDGPVTENTRTLLIIRHAKGDWGAPTNDFDRPLNEQGRRDAPAVGSWLVEHELAVDFAVVSPSTRTVDTWELAAASLASPPPIALDQEVYLGSMDEYVRSLSENVPADAKVAAIVGHSPTCGQLAEWLTAGAGNPEARARKRTKFPTAAVAQVEISVPWSELARATGHLVEFAVCRG